ncbi:hypothetical protein [Candidatus Rariloculus sp.]|uniref:hypothetical protein n=1 Tax=Candidatus Rariloculus sp. TaxID=3101265 RepID=UPI003D0AE2AB
MKKHCLLLSVLVLGTHASLAQNTETTLPNAPGDYRSDSHFHLLDFLQNGEFLNTDGKFPGSEWGLNAGGRYSTLPFGERGRRIEALLAGMNAARVEHLMVSGMPFIKKWSANEPFLRPRYYLDSSSRMKRARDTDITVASAIVDYQRKYADDPERLAELRKIHPFVTGFDGTDLGAVDLIVKRVKEFPGIWQGIGEVMSRHDDLTNLTSGERPRADHPALVRVCRFAGKHFLPVSIHHNIAPISRNSDEIKPPLYLDELVELFRHCRWQEGDVSYTTRFIWCHAGISRRVTIQDLPLWIEEVLKDSADQVYIDLSWVVLEDYVYKELDRWVQLIERHPGRFMIGSDAVGTASRIDEEFNRFDLLLASLPADVRVRVAHDNFADLMQEMAEMRAAAGLGAQGIVLDDGYEFPEYANTGRLPDSESFIRSREQSQ